MKRHRSCRGFTVSLTGMLVGVVLACGVRHDEFDCENAVAHLAQCCPGFDASTVQCTFSGGCNTSYPALDPAQSDCIRGASCETLVAQGVCARAAQLQNAPGSATEVNSASICPPGPLPDAGAAPDNDAADAPGLIVGCTAASQCTAGEICCLTYISLPTVVVSCSPAPCATGLQVCESSAECVGGKRCVAPSVLDGFMACVATPDASPDALPDVSLQTDSSSEASTDEASTDGPPEASSDAGPDAADAAPGAADADVSQ
jgi:hypothetical protein